MDGLLILLAMPTMPRSPRLTAAQFAPKSSSLRAACGRCRGIMDGNLGDKLRFFRLIFDQSGPAASAFDSAAPLESSMRDNSHSRRANEHGVGFTERRRQAPRDHHDFLLQQLEARSDRLAEIPTIRTV